MTGGELFCPPEPALSSGLSEEGSEVRATSHDGSFSSPLETRVEPEVMEDERSTGVRDSG